MKNYNIRAVSFNKEKWITRRDIEEIISSLDFRKKIDAAIDKDIKKINKDIIDTYSAEIEKLTKDVASSYMILISKIKFFYHEIELETPLPGIVGEKGNFFPSEWGNILLETSYDDGKWTLEIGRTYGSSEGKAYRYNNTLENLENAKSLIQTWYEDSVTISLPNDEPDLVQKIETLIEEFTENKKKDINSWLEPLAEYIASDSLFGGMI